jgi:hypothetical protein
LTRLRAGNGAGGATSVNARLIFGQRSVAAADGNPSLSKARGEIH